MLQNVEQKVTHGRRHTICNNRDLNDACINIAAQTIMFMVSINKMYTCVYTLRSPESRPRRFIESIYLFKDLSWCFSP